MLMNGEGFYEGVMRLFFDVGVILQGIGKRFYPCKAVKKSYGLVIANCLLAYEIHR